MGCLDYQRARQLMLLSALVLFIFAVAFLAVGGVSLALGEHFTQIVGEYCIKHCRQLDTSGEARRAESSSSISTEQIVGCDCSSEPPSSSLPTQFLLAPPIGLIVIGVFTLSAAFFACCGSCPAKRASVLRMQHRLLLLLLLLPLIIVVHFSFAVAAVSIAAGAVTADFLAPFSVDVQYKLFDWGELSSFFPEKCYQGTNPNVVVALNNATGDPITYTFRHPLCRFDGACEERGSREELKCCDASLRCDAAKSECAAGLDCLLGFLSGLATPVAAVSFVGLCFELLALALVCVLRTGPGAKSPLMLDHGAAAPPSDEDL